MTPRESGPNPGENRVARCETFDPNRSTVGPVKRQTHKVLNAFVQAEAVSHRQRRSTNPPRLKSSAGKGKPGQHNKQSTSHTPAFQQNNPLLAPTRNHGSNTVQNKEAPPHRGYLCSPTHQNRPKQPLYPPPQKQRSTIRNKHLNQTPQNTDKQNICVGGARHPALTERSLS